MMKGLITTIVSVFTLVVVLMAMFTDHEREGKWKQTYYGMRSGILTHEYEMHMGDTTFFKIVSESAAASAHPWTMTTIIKSTEDIEITETEMSMGGKVDFQRDTTYKK